MQQRFRLQGKTFFLTYPRCPDNWTKEAVKLALDEKDFGPAAEYVVGKEQHADGTPHFHVFLRYNNRLDTSNQRYFDIYERHGKYEVARRQRAAIQYCKKDGDFISNIPGDDPAKPDKTTKNKNLLEMALKQGPQKVLEEGLISLKEYVWFNNGLELYKKQAVVDEREDLPTRLPNTWDLDLIINLDVKKCHYWIWSDQPNKGKTTFLLELQKKYRVEGWNLFENFQSTITQSTEVIYFDEFRGQVKISLLNALCDGTLQIPRKGLPSLKIDTKPLIIICGNLPPEKCYKEHLQQYIEARFNIICLN